MKILGVSSNYHDASATLVVNGQVLFSSTEERFTRIKHDPSLPIEAIRHCLKETGLSASEIDMVAYHEDPANKMSRTLVTSLSNWPRSLKTFLKTAEEAVNTSVNIKSDLIDELRIASDKIIQVPHHLSHAAQAFLSSGLDSSTVVTIDAVGEWISSAIFSAEIKNNKINMQALDISPFPNSLGLAYSAFTAYLGFKVNDGECSTMALGAFGEPKYTEAIKKIIQIQPDGSHELDLSFFDFTSDNQIPVSKKFIEIFGSPRNFKDKLNFSTFNKIQNVSSEHQRFADIAASLQLVLEEAVISYIKKAHALNSNSSLCYAGGVALNCVANSKLIKNMNFKNIYIPPDPGDGGGSMGAALYVSALSGHYQKKTISPFLGHKIRTSEISFINSHINTSKWHHFSKKLSSLEAVRSLEIKTYNEDELISELVESFISKKIVGLARDSAENGPRALGNRSILILPNDLELTTKLSRNIKSRELFRPYALTMTLEQAKKSLEFDGPEFHNSEFPKPAYWMQTSYPVKTDFQELFKMGIHVDKSTRVQITEPNSFFEKLLIQLGKKTGYECLLNTSFNESGSPLVTSALDAFIMFARTPIDVLVVDNILIKKLKEQP